MPRERHTPTACAGWLIQPVRATPRREAPLAVAVRARFLSAILADLLFSLSAAAPRELPQN